jgi:hypothetical protein
MWPCVFWGHFTLSSNPETHSQWHIHEDLNIQQHSCGKLKSHKFRSTHSIMRATTNTNNKRANNTTKHNYWILDMLLLKQLKQQNVQDVSSDSRDYKDCPPWRDTVQSGRNCFKECTTSNISTNSYPEDGGSRLLQNTGTLIADYTETY